MEQPTDRQHDRCHRADRNYRPCTRRRTVLDIKSAQFPRIAMASVEIRNVSMAFAGKTEKTFIALDRINLDVNDGEFVCLIGHSGCGKSTLLNLIAGLLLPTEGKVTCEDMPVTGPGPDRAMVFQSHALLPWMTCKENVALGIRQAFRKRLSKAEIQAKAEEVLNLVRLGHAINKYPYEI